MNAKSEALIIGAGPVGLCMGLALAKQGVSFRIIDSALAPVKESRAIGIQARTLEIFEMMGMVNEFLDLGHQLHGVTIYGQSGAKIAHLDMQKVPSRYHFLFTLRQSETERVLGDQLHKLGLQIERQTTLLSFEQSESEVQANISLPNGARERVRTDWLIGCDGAHSRVREILDLKFTGKVYDLQFLLGDFHVMSDLSDDAAHIFARKEGLFALFPLGKGRHRLVADNPPERFRAERNPTIEEWQEVVNQRSSVPMQLTDPDWTADFRVSSRMVEHVRRGRVFLMGDAAHIHSPALAQGMNTGIQDAWNLAWKLSLVQKSLSPLSLLDSYEKERMPVEHSVLKITDFTQKVIAAPRPATLLFRDSLLPFLSGMKAFQKRAGKRISEIAIEYRNSSIVENHRLPKGPHAGDRAPSVEGLQDSKGRRVSLLSIFGTHHVLLVVLGSKDEVDHRRLFAQPIQYVRKQYSDLVRPYLMVENNQLAGQFEIPYLIDSERQVAAMYGDTPAFYLVRPDGYIAFRCRAGHSKSLLAYLQKLFCTSS